MQKAKTFEPAIDVQSNRGRDSPIRGNSPVSAMGEVIASPFKSVYELIVNRSSPINIEQKHNDRGSPKYSLVSPPCSPEVMSKPAVMLWKPKTQHNNPTPPTEVTSTAATPDKIKASNPFNFDAPKPKRVSPILSKNKNFGISPCSPTYSPEPKKDVVVKRVKRNNYNKNHWKMRYQCHDAKIQELTKCIDRMHVLEKEVQKRQHDLQEFEQKYAALRLSERRENITEDKLADDFKMKCDEIDKISCVNSQSCETKSQSVLMDSDKEDDLIAGQYKSEKADNNIDPGYEFCVSVNEFGVPVKENPFRWWNPWTWFRQGTRRWSHARTATVNGNLRGVFEEEAKLLRENAHIMEYVVETTSPHWFFIEPTYQKESVLVSGQVTANATTRFSDDTPDPDRISKFLSHLYAINVGRSVIQLKFDDSSDTVVRNMSSIIWTSAVLASDLLVDGTALRHFQESPHLAGSSTGTVSTMWAYLQSRIVNAINWLFTNRVWSVVGQCILGFLVTSLMSHYLPQIAAIAVRSLNQLNTAC
jgi:hypothetical protein